MSRPPLRAFGATLTLALLSAALPFAFGAPGPKLPADLVRLERARAELQLAAATSAPAATARLAGDGAAAVDTQAPQLTAFRLVASTDAHASGEDARAWYSATDDLSGVTSGYGWLSGPGNTLLTVWLGNSVPARAVTNGAGRLVTTPWAPPGTYYVSQLQISDAAGNWSTWSRDALAAMGATTSIELTNAKGGDTVAPTLVHGHERTPTFSLSAMQPGTGQHAVFAVDLHMNDGSSPQVSGVRVAALSYCLADMTACLHVVSNETVASGVADTTLTAWQVPADQGLAPGTYLLREVDLWDFAGNRRSYVGTTFGGSTDFSTLFNAVKVVLTT